MVRSARAWERTWVRVNAWINEKAVMGEAKDIKEGKVDGR